MAIKTRSSAVMAQADEAIARAATRWSEPKALLEDYESSRRVGGAFAGFSLRAAGPNTVTQMQHEDMRARSRHMIRNDPIAAGVINTNVGSVVGTGLTMRPALPIEVLGLTEEQARSWSAKVAQRFRAWATNVFADATDAQDFYGLQSLALRTVLASGDCGFVLPNIARPRWPFRLSVQLIEADRICNRDRLMDSDTMIAGCEIGSRGETRAYFVADRNPTEIGTKWTRIEARGPRTGRLRMGLLFDQARPGEVRGKPVLAPVLGKLKDLSRYSEAELGAAVTAASLTVFTKMGAEAFSTLFSEEDRQKLVDRGLGWDGVIEEKNTMINLLPGEEIDVPKTNRPNENFDPFFLAMVRQIGIGVEIPFEVLVKHFTSSYSAARAAMLDAWKTFYRRRDWLAKRFCQPIYQEWLANEVASGAIEAPGYFEDPLTALAWSEAKWIGDGPASLDPSKEVDAAEKRLAIGISTLEDESILHDGVDWDVKHAQRVREVTRRREDGLEQDPMAIAQMAADAKATAAPPARANPPQGAGE